MTPSLFLLPEAGPVLIGAGFLFGAIVGSFLATALIRWPTETSVLAGRSRCDACGTTLAARDLIPIFSHILLRGRCRACGTRIDRRHLTVELAGALVGALAFALPASGAAAATALLGWWLLLIAALDLEHQWLPDRLTLPLAAAGLLVGWAGIGPEPLDRLIGLAAGFASLALVALAYRQLRGREGLGGGDPKLFGAIGAWLGWQPLPHVLIGAGLLGLVAMLLVRMRGSEVSATDRLPLGTFLAMAAWPIWIIVSA